MNCCPRGPWLLTKVRAAKAHPPASAPFAPVGSGPGAPTRCGELTEPATQTPPADRFAAPGSHDQASERSPPRQTHWCPGVDFATPVLTAQRSPLVSLTSRIPARLLGEGRGLGRHSAGPGITARSGTFRNADTRDPLLPRTSGTPSSH